MNYNSLGEYFYKLYNICLMMMFIPVAGFLYLYHLVLNHQIQPTINSESVTNICLILFPVLAVIDLTIVHWLARRKLKKLSEELSLGIRLEKYVTITTLRISASVATSLFMAAGMFMTHHEYFSIYFAIIILWTAWQWPTPRKVCRDYRLKGDEEKMVLTKGEAFK